MGAARIASIVAASLLAAFVSHAEPAVATGGVDLHIEVVSANGLALPTALVTLEPSTGRPQTVMTDRRGMAIFREVECVTSSLHTTFPGMATLVLKGLPLCELSSHVVRLCLTETFVEPITLNCRGPIVDVDKSYTSTTFSSEFLGGLPGTGVSSGPILKRKTNRSVHRQVAPGGQCAEAISKGPSVGVQ